MSLVARLAPAAPGAPTLLALHGRGGAEGDLLGLGEALGTGAGVLAPRGPEREGAGYAWFRHHAIGVPDLASLDARLGELAAWLEGAIGEHGLAAPLTAVGFSNGGMMAGALAAARPDLVGDVALLSSAYPLPAQIVALGGLRGRRVLAAGGEDDPFLPMETAAAGIASYRAAGAEVTEAWRPGGHGVGAQEVAALRDWLGGPGAS
jgi:phospholipase/carboxylesterase